MNSTYEYTGHGKASKENAAKIKSSSYDLVNIQYRVRKRKKTKPKSNIHNPRNATKIITAATVTRASLLQMITTSNVN